MRCAGGHPQVPGQADVPHEDAVVEQVQVNGAPGLAVRSRGRTVAILPVEVCVDGVERAWWITDPARLSHWDR